MVFGWVGLCMQSCLPAVGGLPVQPQLTSQLNYFLFVFLSPFYGHFIHLKCSFEYRMSL